jgi:hypothetical protein
VDSGAPDLEEMRRRLDGCRQKMRKLELLHEQSPGPA